MGRWAERSGPGPHRDDRSARGGQAECPGRAGERLCAQGSGEAWEPGAALPFPFSASEARLLSSSGHVGGVSPRRVSERPQGPRGGQSVFLALLNVGPCLSIQQEFFSMGSGF